MSLFNEFGQGFNCDRCEHRNFFIGAKGICIPENLTCICPDGFSGRDDWLDYADDCQVNLRLKNVLHLIALSVSCVGVVCSAVIGIYLACKWRFVPENMNCITRDQGQEQEKANNENTDDYNTPMAKSDMEQEASRERSAANSHSRARSPTREPATQEAQKLRMRKLMVLVMAFIFCVGNVFYVYMMSIYVSGNIRGKDRPFLDYVANYSSIIVITGLYAWFYSAYLTLPDIKKYGAILKLDSFLARNPDFVPRFLVFTVVIMYIFYTILASIQVAVPRTRHTLDIVHLAGFIPFAVPLILIYELISRNVKRLLKMAIVEYNNHDRQGTGWSEKVDTLEKSIGTIKLLKATIVSPVLQVIFINALSSALKARYEYFFYSLAITTGSIATIMFTIFAALYTDGGLAPNFSRVRTGQNSRNQKHKRLSEV